MVNSYYKQINRYILIFNILKEKKYSTKKEIKSKLGNKFGSFSDRTFTRDIKSLREDFSINIEYKKGDGYYLDKEAFEDDDKIKALLHLIDSTLFKLKNSNNKQFVQPDLQSSLKGSEHLEDIYYALSNSYKLKITHKKFDKEHPFVHIVSPLFLKEYNHRWYIYAKNHKNEFRSYSIDRIKEVEVLTDKKIEKENIDYDTFRNTIGISGDKNNVKKVVLEFDKTQIKYIKTSPLHQSQEILEENDQMIKIELTVVQNWELEEIILKYGELVKVIEPEGLRNNITERLKKAINNYNFF
jgi:predicted DNA-binding transcriptional regulator YafY